MKRLILILFIFQLFTNAVIAQQQPLVGVVGVGYKELEDNPVMYDSSSIKGEKLDVVENDSMYFMIHYEDELYRRVEDRYDHISVPPNSTVGFVVWFLNNTYSEVNIYDIDFFFSRSNLDEGDITRLGAVASYSNHLRKSREFKINRTIPPSLLLTGNTLFEFKTIQPLHIRSFTGNFREDNSKRYIDFALELENISEYNLCNIKVSQELPSFNHFEQSICINKRSKKEIKYSDEITNIKEGTIVTKEVVVKDTNSHIEAINSLLIDPHNPDNESAAMLFSSDYGTHMALGALSKALKVELLPYWLHSEPIELSIPQANKSVVNRHVSSNTSIPPKYSFTIINRIKKDNSTVKPSETKSEVLGSTTMEKNAHEKYLYICIIIGVIFICGVIWFLRRLW